MAAEAARATPRPGGYPDTVTQTPVAPARSGHAEVGHSTSNRAGSGRAGAARRRAYVALTKPRIIELLLVTTLPSMILAADGLPNWWVVVATLVGGTLAAGSANALNCYVDRDIDALMRRTGHRPLARHEVSPRGALVFGVVLGAVVGGADGRADELARRGAHRGRDRVLRLVYTMLLKRRTAQNIVWGGAAGCMPVLIGWAAVTGSLAWAAARPVRRSSSSGRRRTSGRSPSATARTTRGPACRCCRSSPRRVRVAREIVVYAWLTALTSLALWPLATGWVYGVLALVAGAALVGAAHRLLRRTGSGKDARPMQLFHLSNSYLAFVFVAIAVDTFVR